MKMNKYILLVLILLIFLTVQVDAQMPLQGRGANGDMGMQLFDPSQMQKMIENRLKEQLDISDEEWTVIGPKVIKVVTLSFQSRGNPIGAMRMILPFGNRPGRPGDQGISDRQNRSQSRNMMPDFLGAGESEVDTAMEELQTILENKNADPNQIKQAVTKVRRAKEKGEREAAAAKKELRELLSVRQEAFLISMGLLD